MAPSIAFKYAAPANKLFIRDRMAHMVQEHSGDTAVPTQLQKLPVGERLRVAAQAGGASTALPSVGACPS